MGLNQDPLCSYCSAAEESASHFLRHCDYFSTRRMRIWGKPDLCPADIDTATVGDIARFKKISEIPIEYPALTGRNHRGWLMDPHCGLSLRGDRSPCHTLELWNYGAIRMRSGGRSCPKAEAFFMNWRINLDVSVSIVQIFQRRVGHDGLSPLNTPLGWSWNCRLP